MSHSEGEVVSFIKSAPRFRGRDFAAWLRGSSAVDADNTSTMRLRISVSAGTVEELSDGGSCPGNGEWTGKRAKS